MDAPENTSNAQDYDSEDDVDWEEVQLPPAIVPINSNLDLSIPSQEAPKHLEIILKAKPKAEELKKKPGISHAERLLRIDCHKIHTICLLANARIRNKWINDPLLHARLLSLTPLALQNSFAMIHKSRVPDVNKRGRLFEAAVTRLAEWWSSEFFDVKSEGHIRNLTFDHVNETLVREGISLTEKDAVIDEEVLMDILDDDGEFIRSEKSLMKHALMQTGSRDTSAQLFTALCRALDIPSRLVVSLQSVPWQSSVGKPKAKLSKKKGKQRATDEDDGEEYLSAQSTTQKSEKAKGKERARNNTDHPKLRRPKPTAGSVEESSPPNPSTTPPVFWTEVFSRADGRWLCIDPIRCIVNKRKVFDPSPVSTSSTSATTHTPTFPFSSTSATKVAKTRTYRQENRLLYVVAFEEDGFARDVTRRYAREYGSKVAKIQGGNGRKIWWDFVMGNITRPYRLLRDDMEDEELNSNEIMEGMPTTISGFKDHPIYVLARHLKQTEALMPSPPDTPILGNFRGEPVYPRSAVVSLKTPENWMRKEGRQIKEGSIAFKYIKMRANTVGKMREIEGIREQLNNREDSVVANDGEVMQGLYARSQTEPYIPDSVVDGKVPKNAFGNIDLYVPSMLPKGGVHIPFKGTAKIAKKLGIDYAEAVTGFEFKKRRAFPVIEGIVIAQGNESLILEAFWESERNAEEQARAKKEARVIKRWAKLIHGLRIRERLKAEYGLKTSQTVTIPEQVSITPSVTKAGIIEIPMDNKPEDGNVVNADDVVQPYHLPKDLHVRIAPYPPQKPITPSSTCLASQPARQDSIVFATFDVDSDDELNLPLLYGENPTANNDVKTLQEMAAGVEDDAEKDQENSIIKDAMCNDSTLLKNPKQTKQAAITRSTRSKKPTPQSRTRGKPKKRKRGDEEEEEEEITSDTDEPQAAVKERSRKKRAPSSSVPPPSTRVLRSRAPKNATAL